MPPKKATQETKENVVAFGRVKNNLKMGCVGLPNVGKSSLFNLCMQFSELFFDLFETVLGADDSSQGVNHPETTTIILENVGQAALKG